MHWGDRRLSLPVDRNPAPIAKATTLAWPRCCGVSPQLAKDLLCSKVQGPTSLRFQTSSPLTEGFSPVGLSASEIHFHWVLKLTQ